MRKLMILALLGAAMFINSAKGQSNKVVDFTSVDVQPAFPGGISNFMNYLGKEIKYPNVAKKNHVQGKVHLSFIVEKSGELKDIKVIKGLTTETNAEAIRVLKSSPKWNPGLVKGKPVRVKYHLPINFKLS
ncbi:energy transducer TonB [Pedobacter endophyticus]|uniref:Energy transducer TonB n=1 Tax=Pedobacter endophyticus TaxID=2789740 RepID=A0A7U3Q4S0_9SPHI|nr:energy transducer TonB [Pedobacter endophyticus]QPH37655.1 energy transducer TonB [Pedobacter endophyticus]